MSDYTPTTARVRDSYAARHIPKGVRATVAKEGFDRWLAEHDAKVRAEALREAYADLQAYTDSGAPFGHRPVEEFLLHRADRIREQGRPMDDQMTPDAMRETNEREGNEHSG